MRSFIISTALVNVILAAGFVAGNIAPVHAEEVGSRAMPAPVATADGTKVSKIKRCGMEWKATKPHTDGLTWSKYWHFCSVAVKSDPSIASKPVGDMHFATK